MDSFKEFFELNVSEHEIVNLYRHSNTPIREISRLTHRSVGDIYRILEKHKVSLNRRDTTHHEVAKHYLNSNMKINDVAKLMNLSARQVYNIRKNAI